MHVYKLLLPPRQLPGVCMLVPLEDGVDHIGNDGLLTLGIIAADVVDEELVAFGRLVEERRQLREREHIVDILGQSVAHKVLVHVQVLLGQLELEFDWFSGPEN